ncbi:MAG TPA: DUF6328 family protein [Gaiellaceae bacterium]|nr:DUF6328 family protein [Gaiellaceae bacterium]
MTPEETPKQRTDRELIELLNEVRVGLPGVQVLFAFLLALPFSTGFAKMTTLERDAYYVSLISTTLAAAFMIATPSFHRLRWRVESKEHIVKLGNSFTIVAFALLAVAMVSAVLMVTSFLFGAGSGIAAAVGMGIVFFVLWYGIAFGAWLRGPRRERRR